MIKFSFLFRIFFHKIQIHEFLTTTFFPTNFGLPIDFIPFHKLEKKVSRMQ